MRGFSPEVNRLVGEPRAFSGEHSIARGLNGQGMEAHLLMAGQVNRGQEQGQRHCPGVNGGNQYDAYLRTEGAFLLRLNVFPAWASIRINKAAFRTLVLQPLPCP